MAGHTVVTNPSTIISKWQTMKEQIEGLKAALRKWKNIENIKNEIRWSQWHIKNLQNELKEKKSQKERDYNEISILYTQLEFRVMIMEKELERLMPARRTVDRVMDTDMATDSLERTPEGEPRNQQNTYRGNYLSLQVFIEESEAKQRELRKVEEMLKRVRRRLKGKTANLLGTVEENEVHGQKQENCCGQVRLDEVVGRGAFGEVWIGELCGTKVAVKRPRKNSSECQNLFDQEVRIMLQLQHPNVVNFIVAIVDDDGLLCIVEEYADGGSFGELLKKGPLTRLEVFSFSLDAGSGLLYLHTRSVPILHRDLHPFNLLLFLIDKPPGKVLKLCDFGTANFLRSTMTPDQGAPCLNAPETRTQHYTTKADVYSFGLLLLIMSIRDWPESENLTCQVQEVSDTSLQELIKECTAQNPELRPDMGKVVAKLVIMKSGAVSTHF